MPFKYMTTVDTYDKDFDKAVNKFPRELFDKFTINMKVNVGKNVSANDAAHIAVFIIRSLEIGDEHEVEFELATDENLTDEVEILLEA